MTRARLARMTMTSQSERLRRAISRRDRPNSRLSAELRAEASTSAERKAVSTLNLLTAYPPGLRKLVGPREGRDIDAA